MFKGERLNYSERQSENPEMPNLDRRKKELIGFYMSDGNTDFVLHPNTKRFNKNAWAVSDKEPAQKILQENSGTREKEKKLLGMIDGANHRYSTDEIFNGMRGDKHQKRILGYMSVGEAGWEFYENTSGSNVAGFLRKYPTPIDFEEDSNDFLMRIQGANSEQKFQEYCDAMDEFQQRVYGEKYEYYKAMQEMGAESREIISRPEMEKVSFSRIKAFEAKGILRNTKIEGEPVSFTNKPEHMISAKEFWKNDLEPKFKIGLEGVEYNVSKAFRLGSRNAVICCVKTPDGRMVARSYYRSLSQGVWRYMPDYKKDDERVTWYGKGLSEQQLTLPMEIQDSLNRIVEESNGEEATPAMREMFFGTAGRVREMSYYHNARRINGEIRDALQREVQSKPEEELNKWSSPNPEMMKLPIEMSPNFDHQIGSFEMSSEQYGQAKGRLFPSRNGEMTWSILEDGRGRSCVAGVQTKSKITSTGLRESWIDAGDFAMPLYEYPNQALGRGDENDTSSRYVGMWKNYLSKIPLIQEYTRLRSEGEIT